MKFLFLLVLLSPSLALPPEARKPNIVTKFLSDILVQLFDQLSTEGLSIPHLDLKENGNLSNVKAEASGLTKNLDGISNYGFKLHTTVSKAMVCGEYHIVDLDVPGLFPFFGKGHFQIALEAIDLKMTLEAQKNFGTGKFDFKLPEFSVQLQSSKVKFDNLMEDPYVADFLNELISNLLPDLVPVIAERLRSDPKGLPAVIDKYGNGVFDCLKFLTKDRILQCIKDLFIKEKLLF